MTMHATIRRYEAIDQSRTSELIQKVETGLLPRLRQLPGFSAYSLIDAGNGVISSVGFYDSPENADESTRVASNWIREEKLEAALPHQPKTTNGQVVVHEVSELAAV